MTLVIRFQRLDPADADIDLPARATAGASGLDIRAAVREPLCLLPGQRAAVPTGLAVELPPGHELQVRPRSGLALQHGIACLNSPGTIDADYRGEIRVILANLGEQPWTVRRGERIAQLVLARVLDAEIRLVESLGSTERGPGGFGSTGT